MHSNCSRSFQKRPTCNKPLKSGCVIAIPGDLALRVYAPGDCVDGSLAINFREGRALPNKPVKVAIASNIGPDNLSAVIDTVSRGSARFSAWNVERNYPAACKHEAVARGGLVGVPITDNFPL